MKLTTTMTILAATLVSIGGLHARAQSTVEVKVPFDFTVSNQELPAGTYEIRYEAFGSHTLEIQNKTAGGHVYFSTFDAYGKPRSRDRLIFARYGEKYFLHEVLCDDAEMNAEVPRSAREKRARIMMAQGQTQKAPPNEIAIAALRVGPR